MWVHVVEAGALTLARRKVGMKGREVEGTWSGGIRIVTGPRVMGGDKDVAS